LQYNFAWDPKKARYNLRKHRVSFERAAEIFFDPSAISILDEENRDQEERWVTLGKDSHGIALVIVHTFREDPENQWNVRIISARKATKKERKQYEEGAK
jgi:uncharacterized DUF497 family protein